MSVGNSLHELPSHSQSESATFVSRAQDAYVPSHICARSRT